MVAALAVLAMAGELVPDPGFEQDARWQPYGSGFVFDAAVRLEGSRSIRCESATESEVRGASCTIQLNQEAASPIVFSGWSRAEGVSGSRDSDYSLYIDAVHQDGTPLWGTNVPFDVGTHDWQRRSVVLAPTKPLRSVTVYALFRRHKGRVWFDDFRAKGLGEGEMFDFLPASIRWPSKGRVVARLAGGGLSLGFGASGSVLEADGRPVLRPGGLYLRPFGDADGAVVPLVGSVRRSGSAVFIDASVGRDVRASAVLRAGAAGWSGTVDLACRSREPFPATVYFVLPLPEKGGLWWDDPRSSRSLGGTRELGNLLTVPYGANGLIGRYPFGCVQSGDATTVLAEGFAEPVVHRVFANRDQGCLALAWDVALGGDRPKVTLKWNFARLRGDLGAWGFRGATEWFYRLHPQLRERRLPRQGLWMPFKDPSEVEGVQDFGVAFHEGDNSVDSDDRLGILSFRYTEPMTFWMPMPPEAPRTYEAALETLRSLANGDSGLRDQARAALRCATRGRDGEINLQFREEPWCNGAVFVLNPSPSLGGGPGNPTKAWLNYNPLDADRWHPVPKNGDAGLDGQYLDSLEGWSEVLNYAEEHLRLSPYAPTFDADGRAVLPQWYQSYEFAEFVARDLRRRGYYLFANAVPIAHPIFCRLLDVMGIETNWAPNGSFQPDSDASLLYRRLFSAGKPYLLLQNTDFDRFPPEWMERYVDRAAFYGMFPSMFSPDASTRVYWDRPDLVNRDRALFKDRVPKIRRLSEAGWQPVTHARSSDSHVWLERFGNGYLTVLNASAEEKDVPIRLEARGFPSRPRWLTDLLRGARFRVAWSGSVGTARLRLKPEQTMVLEGRAR
ncbi:MAG TPA: hypothetical protein DER07_01410 [Armatimonadetes bacterium]|nr:hypothetical protein [Armatimonadota bacterium]